MKSVLEASGETRWLDVGSGGKSDNGFDLLDVLPEELVKPSGDARYFRADIANISPHLLSKLRGYDLVRMQHVLEHLSFEDGLVALNNCAQMLRPGGYLLVTVPDLQIHIRRYLTNSYDHESDPGYFEYATARLPADAPASAFFSMYAHSLTFEPHLWCYDFQGLRYQAQRTEMFESIRELSTDDPLASFPFTHNRPAEDVCLIANRRT